MTTTTPTELDRLPAGPFPQLRDLAAAVDAADAAILAATGTIDDGLHDDYAWACEDLLDAVREEAAEIRAVLEHGYRLTNHLLPAGAGRVADALDAYADDLEARRGMI